MRTAFFARLHVSLLLAVVSLLLPAATFAEIDLTLFEKTFERGTGEPATTGDAFVGTARPATLMVQTGSEVTSALVEVNGSLIFGPSDFKKKTPDLTATV